jgi:DNA-binding GntR family transcriptional regulator
VTESQLAAQFAFGRAAVRAALTRLSHDRLLQAIPRHGYEIAPITFKHVQDLFGVRLIIEPAAARLAATRADDRLVAHLAHLNQACARTDNHDNPAPLRDANKAFHVAIAQVAGNDRLADMVGVVMDEMDRVLYLPQLANVWERIDATFDEHERLLAAIRARNPDVAERAATDHILPNRQFVIDALIASPQLRSINLVGV